jgi:hypothetical protein
MPQSGKSYQFIFYGYLVKRKETKLWVYSIEKER